MPSITTRVRFKDETPTRGSGAGALPGQTDAEQKLWQSRRHRPLSGHKVRHEHNVDHHIADFAFTEALLIFDRDGGQPADQAHYDARCTRHLQARRYRVLRFWNNDVLTNLESVLTVSLGSLASMARHPNPLPAGARE